MAAIRPYTGSIWKSAPLKQPTPPSSPRIAGLCSQRSTLWANPSWIALERRSVAWTERMIRGGKYYGWIATDAGRPVASAGLLILDWPPHPFDPEGELRGYLLNIYVEPEYRKRGLAHQLVERSMAEARRRGIRVVTLHSSQAGRPIYERFGFHATNEMMHTEPAKN